MSRISVIIPVYNSAQYVVRCIDSVIAQTFQDWELICVDDGSKDNSLDILRNYSKKDSRIRVIHQENAGPGIARNTAIKEAKGEYVVFVDSDDTVAPDYFELLSKHDEDVVYIDVQDVDERGRILRKEYMSRYKHLAKDDILRGQMTGRIPWGGWRKCVKMKVLRGNNIQYTNHKIGEEALYSYQVLLYAKTVGFIEKPLYSYVQRSDSQSHLKVDDAWGDVAIELRKKVKELGDYETYANTINAFILAAAAGAANRLALNYSFREYLERVRYRRNLLYRTLDERYATDYHNMDKRAILMGFLLKNKLYCSIWLASRLREKLR